MSFIKKKNEKSSSLWDWVFLAVIVVGGLSFWWYYKNQKDKTFSGFTIADSLFQSGSYDSALKKYEELRNSDYLEPTHDSILSERLDTLYTLLDK